MKPNHTIEKKINNLKSSKLFNMKFKRVLRKLCLRLVHIKRQNLAINYYI